MKWEIKHFSELELKELYKILRIRNEVFIVEQNCPYLDCDNKDLDAYHIFCEINEDIAVYSRILKRGISYNEVSIGRVLCSKNFRGKGISKECIEKAINFIKSNLEEERIRISAQEYAKEFYEKCGFRQVSERYLEDDIPHIEMLYGSDKESF